MLTFGYNQGMPVGVDTAWGARAILSSDGYIDIPPDRQQVVGIRKELLIGYLNDEFNMGHLRQKVKEEVQPWEEDSTYTLFEDDIVSVKCRAAGGYLYLCAYLNHNEEGEPLNG